MSAFNPCIVIPVYNHGSTLAATVEQLLFLQLPVIVVDDGSNQATKDDIAAVAQQFDVVTVKTLAENQGKGGAVMAGLKLAYELGYSHALQVDADGQHNIQDAPQMLQMAQNKPQVMISGRPIYDASVPKGRFYGRYVTHVWVWIETLSFRVKDTMCGFRVYPLKQCVEIINQYHLGKRMDFDTEIMVRFNWAGGEIEFLPTKVIYPEDGTSHFNAIKDNWLLTKMHTKLFFGMLPRIPLLLWRKVTR